MLTLTRAHKALLALLAAMAMLLGQTAVVLLDEHATPQAVTASTRRPDEDEEDDSDDDSDSDDEEEDESNEDTDDEDDSESSDDDEVDEDELPDNVKEILKKNRAELRKAKRELREAREAKRSAKPAAKPKPKPKPADGDEDDDPPSEREVKATQKLQRANLISALSKSKHGLTDPAAAAKLAITDGLADFDEDDEPQDIDDLVKDLVDEYAFLKGEKPKRRAPNVDSGNGRTKTAPKLTADELKAAKAADMTPEEYAAFKSPQPKLPAKKKT